MDTLIFRLAGPVSELSEDRDYVEIPRSNSPALVFPFLFGKGGIREGEVSGSNGGESSRGEALEGIGGQVLELEGLLDAVDDSSDWAGFLADWPDREAADPDAVGPDGPSRLRACKWHSRHDSSTL